MAFFEGQSRKSSEPWLMQPAANIEDVFASVERGDTLLGVVPVENSTEGAVNLWSHDTKRIDSRPQSQPNSISYTF
jgi:prephenate dehydratase